MTLQNGISEKDRVIWIHTASLGEFEQGLPVIEKLKSDYPDHKILITFFSPSGYEVKKNTPVADLVCYLPMDTASNAKKFLKIVRPRLAIFVKYEIWPNYLRALKREKVPSVLISALFKKEQVFFKWYGNFMRKALETFSYFFVQDVNSKKLLDTIGVTRVGVSGDTRFDRVSEILNRDNSLEFMEHFKQDRLCLVAGSTWPEGESFLADYINHGRTNAKFVVAPHDIKVNHIKNLKESFTKKVVLYSDLEHADVSDADVLIIDTIGLLTKIYSYADIAYVGGAFATGLHNTLEPAVFGIPVIIGPNYAGFREAEALVAQGGILSVNNKSDFNKVLNQCIEDAAFRKLTGKINAVHIEDNKGASIQIMAYIRTLLN